MRRPLILLAGIIVSIMVLSIIFPADPQKPDLISRIRNLRKKAYKPVQTASNYKVSNLLRIDDSGSALIWTIDEKYLYYSKKVDKGGLNNFEEIWVCDLKGNKENISSGYKFHSIRETKWSSDGTMLGFISDTDGNKGSLYIYDTVNKSISDITPKNVSDIGVTSYDWDDESLSVIMSIDIVNPSIDIYNIRSKKYRRLDMELNSCRNVAFYKDGGIIFSDKDENSNYNIYTADISGRNKKFIIEGQDFILSPDRQKLAILTDAHYQPGLWFYNIANKKVKMLSTWPVHNIYWLSNSNNFIFSMEEDCNNKHTYKGSIYFLEEGLKTSDITGAIHTMFVSSKSGQRIAITSPSDMEDIKENKGVFIGQLNR